MNQVLDHRCYMWNIHKCLIRDDGPLGLNDEWQLLTTLSPNLDMFIQQFRCKTLSSGTGQQLLIWEYWQSFAVLPKSYAF